MKIYTAVFGLIFASFVAQGQQAFSLQQAIEYALQHQNALKLKQIEVSDAHSQINEFKAIGLPRLDASIDYQRAIQLPTSILPAEFFGGSPGEFAKVQFGTDNSLSGHLDFSVLLFDGNYLQGLKAAKLYEKLVAKGINVTQEEITENVTRAYLAVLIADENIRIVDRNIGNVQKILLETSQFYEAGFAEQLDVDRLRLSLDNLITQRHNLDQLVEIGLNVLKFQMGYPMNQVISVTEDLDALVNLLRIEQVEAPSVDDPIDFNKRAEYDAILTGIELNHIDLKRLKHGYLPTVKLQASHSQSLQRNKIFGSNEPGFLPATSAGIRVNIPIFDGNEKKSQIQRTKLRMERTEIEKIEFERAMELQVRNARIQFINAKNTLDLRSRALALNEGIYDKTLIKFKEGVGSSVEVSQAEASLYEAQANYINALYDLVLAKTDLDAATGDL